LTELSLLSVSFIVAGYLTAAAFIIGFLWKLWRYAVTPSPLKIPLTPAPKTVSGVIGKNILDIFTFRSLFNSDKRIWLGGYLLHLALLLLFLRHLNFFVETVNGFLESVEPWGVYAGFFLPAPLLYLMGLRKAVDRLAYISAMADYFALALLLLTALTGIAMKVYVPELASEANGFLAGFVNLHPVNIPAHPLFLAHFTLALVLGFYFPFSKLMHAGGLLFSPTITQPENCREVRHVNPWQDEVR